MLRLFAEDANFEHADGRVSHVGKAQIAEGFGKGMVNRGFAFHYVHRHAVRFTAPRLAEGIADAHAEMGQQDRFVLAAIRYNDNYRKEDSGRWVFTRRVISFWYSLPHSRLDEGFVGRSRREVLGILGPADLPESLLGPNGLKR
jgi:SnoaL-like protein